MDSTPAWKLALLKDALPKFTTAIEACKNSEDTSEAKAHSRVFLKQLQEIIFPNEPMLLAAESQDTRNKDEKNSEILINKVIKELKEVLEQEKVYKTQV